MSRKWLYSQLSNEFGKQYHTADIRSIDEARAVYRKILELSRNKAPHRTDSA